MMAAYVRRFTPALAGLALGVGIIVGCAGFTSPDGLVEITVDRAEYVAGQKGTATVTNVSDETVYYNLCQRRIERRSGAQWTAAPGQPVGQTCLGIAYSLAPGASAQTQFELPPALPEGTYRVRFMGFSKDGGEGPRDQASEVFLVEQPTYTLHSAR